MQVVAVGGHLDAPVFRAAGSLSIAADPIGLETVGCQLLGLPCIHCPFLYLSAPCHVDGYAPHDAQDQAGERLDLHVVAVTGIRTRNCGSILWLSFLLEYADWDRSHDSCSTKNTKKIECYMITVAVVWHVSNTWCSVSWWTILNLFEHIAPFAKKLSAVPYLPSQAELIPYCRSRPSRMYRLPLDWCPQQVHLNPPTLPPPPCSLPPAHLHTCRHLQDIGVPITAIITATLMRCVMS